MNFSLTPSSIPRSHRDYPFWLGMMTPVFWCHRATPEVTSTNMLSCSLHTPDLMMGKCHIQSSYQLSGLHSILKHTIQLAPLLYFMSNYTASWCTHPGNLPTICSVSNTLYILSLLKIRLGLERWLNIWEHWLLFQGHKINSQHLHGSSQLSVTSVPGGSIILFWLLRVQTTEVMHIHACRQNTHIHKPEMHQSLKVLGVLHYGSYC